MDSSNDSFARSHLPANKTGLPHRKHREIISLYQDLYDKADNDTSKRNLSKSIDIIQKNSDVTSKTFLSERFSPVGSKNSFHEKRSRTGSFSSIVNDSPNSKRRISSSLEQRLAALEKQSEERDRRIAELEKANQELMKEKNIILENYHIIPK